MTENQGRYSSVMKEATPQEIETWIQASPGLREVESIVYSAPEKLREEEPQLIEASATSSCSGLSGAESRSPR